MIQRSNGYFYVLMALAMMIAPARGSSCPASDFTLVLAKAGFSLEESDMPMVAFSPQKPDDFLVVSRYVGYCFERQDVSR